MPPMQNPELTQLHSAASSISLPEVTPSSQSNRSALLIVFLVVFIDLLGFGIILPLLPRYADTYLAHLLPGGKKDPMGGLILGALMSAFSLMQFIFAPLWGKVSDHVGRRPILLLGLLGSVAFYTLFGVASDLPAASAAELALVLLFVARIGAGVAGATISTAQAVIADCTPPEKRKHGMALIGAAFGIGFTFGPLIGFASLSWLPNHHGVIGYVAAFLSLVALILGLRLLPETHAPDSRTSWLAWLVGPLVGFRLPPETRRFAEAPRVRKWIEWRGLRTALASPALWPVVLVFFLATFGFGMFEPTLALLIQDALKLSENDSFLIFAFVGAVLLLTQGLLYRRLANRVSEPTFICAGILLMALGLAALGGVTLAANGSEPPNLDTLLTWTLVSLAVAVIGFAFLTPSAQALVSRRSDPTKQGEILGANQSASALARILGPAIGLPLYKLQESHLLPYAFGAVLLLLMLPLIPRIRRG
jgi:MFS family permease